MWKCGYRYLSSEKLHKICQLVPTLQIREQLVNVWFFSAVSCSFLNASIHFLWTLNYAMTEYRVILLTANFSIWRHIQAMIRLHEKKKLQIIIRLSITLHLIRFGRRRPLQACFINRTPSIATRRSEYILSIVT